MEEFAQILSSSGFKRDAYGQIQFVLTSISPDFYENTICAVWEKNGWVYVTEVCHDHSVGDYMETPEYDVTVDLTLTQLGMDVLRLHSL